MAAILPLETRHRSRDIAVNSLFSLHLGQSEAAIAITMIC